MLVTMRGAASVDRLSGNAIKYSSDAMFSCRTISDNQMPQGVRRDHQEGRRRRLARNWRARVR